MISTLAFFAVIVTAITGVISLALILSFLWRVYERGGHIDLSFAARALRQVHDPNWASTLLRLMPRPTSRKAPSASSHSTTPPTRGSGERTAWLER